jgi:hypothetical protein
VKNQYFGDINDYRKYGLMRALSGYGQITTAVCWMLTPDDGRTDGSFTDYLEEAEKWSHHDDDLYRHLRKLVVRRKRRDVGEIENSGILPGCRFFSDLVPDDRRERDSWFRRFLDLAEGCDLIFFDPDNGIEVKSRPRGHKDSSKYLYWHEIEQAFQAGHSLLIYQHFPREERHPFIERKAREVADRTGAAEVLSLRTPRVLFLLAPQEERLQFFRERSKQVAHGWAWQITVASHTSSIS